MSRGRSNVRLPHALQRELGLELQNGRGRGGQNVRGRRERRQTDRVERKPNIRGRGGLQRALLRWQTDNGDIERGLDRLEQKEPRKSIATSRSQPQPPESFISRPKSILKKPKPRSPSPDADSRSESLSSRASSPGLVLDANSRSYKDRLAEDDDEIAALEKKLGLKKNKTSGTALNQDGLGDLIDGLDTDDYGDDGGKRKREEREWLARKRQRHQEQEKAAESEEDEVIKAEADGSDDDSEDMEEQDESVLISGNIDSEDQEASPGLESDSEHQPPQPRPKKLRENPYVPPVATSAATTKYVPPSLRRVHGEDSQSLERLKRQIQGHLNKLSEANLVSILNEIETIYRSNARQDVTSTLLDLLLSQFCDRAALQSTFVLLHAAFCSALYKVIGTDFGAELISRIVDRFSHYHSDASNTGKESLNLMSLLSHLFTFHLISGNLIYSHIDLLLTPLSESNTELLLRIIRDCGPQLRSDDPSALKSAVSQTQTAAQALPPPVSVRTQFMLETIADLKNNKMRDSTATSALTREHITKLRKTLGSLNSRSLRATEPLRFLLDDLRNSDRRGKWWLVGASWKGRDTSPPTSIAEATKTTTTPHTSQPDLILEEATDTVPSYRALAHHLSLPSPLHLSILTALTSASTAQDGLIRLSKLRLKRAQEPEVARVLLRCCGMEEGFNSYYVDVARRLCETDLSFVGGNGSGNATGKGNESRGGTRRWKKMFEFAFWALLRRLGDGNDADHDNDNYHDDANDNGSGPSSTAANISMTEIFNTSKLYAHLISSSTLTLCILRPLDLLVLSEKASLFIELLFVNIFTLSQGKGNTGTNEQDNERDMVIRRIFERLVDARAVVGRVRVFLKRVVKGSDLVGKQWKDRTMAKRGVKVALQVLQEISQLPS